MTEPDRVLAASEQQITDAPQGHILTNIGVWSPDGEWIVYDTRSDPGGSVFDGTRIERVNVHTREVQVVYESNAGARCGVATYSPTEEKIAFILGPANPSADWDYAPSRRRGVIVDLSTPGRARDLDARDLVAPFTPGALRGGTHVHVFSGDGRWISFTYQDHILAQFEHETPDNDIDLRNVGVSIPGAVAVPPTHPRNHGGDYFSVLITQTTARPRPGSDEIRRAFEDAWVGVSGYVRANGSRQARAIAFQGEVVTADGTALSEVFLADLADDLTVPGAEPLQGTATRRPLPPRGVTQRRLTYSADRSHPGLQGPRHWLRSSPDGARIGCLMRDDVGIVQFWTVSPLGGAPVQVTHNPWNVTSAFTWSPDGRHVAFGMDNSVFATDIKSGHSVRVTPRVPDADAPRPEACVFSPDGAKVAYVRAVRSGNALYNQIFVAKMSL